MRRLLLCAAAAALLGVGPPAAGARTATEAEADCVAWCGEKAAEKCDDVTSTWCNAYIIGCLAGCGVAHL